MGWTHTCPSHGVVAPLWRPKKADYESFADLVNRVPDLPTYLPWPLSPGWSISDFGCVNGGDDASATVTSVHGSSDLDGEVEVTVVAEDPGVGLGARCAGTAYVDPGDQIGEGAPSVHVRVSGRTVPLWIVEAEHEELLTGVAFAGEADGRWLWLVMRPAPAALLLQDDWLLADVTGFGPEALEIPFGGARPGW